MHGGLIEIGPLKWPGKAVFISFLDKEIIICEDLTEKGGAYAWDSRQIKK